jgi:hypothetical protein
MNGRSVRPLLRVACPATDSCRREPSVGGERAFQPVVPHRGGGLADPRPGDFPVEGVDSPRPHVQLGRSVSLPDPAGVGEDLVAQVLGGAAVGERARQAARSAARPLGPGRRRAASSSRTPVRATLLLLFVGRKRCAVFARVCLDAHVEELPEPGREFQTLRSHDEEDGQDHGEEDRCHAENGDRKHRCAPGRPRRAPPSALECWRSLQNALMTISARFLAGHAKRGSEDGKLSLAYPSGAGPVLGPMARLIEVMRAGPPCGGHGRLGCR